MNALKSSRHIIGIRPIQIPIDSDVLRWRVRRTNGKEGMSETERDGH